MTEHETFRVSQVTNMNSVTADLLPVITATLDDGLEGEAFADAMMDPIEHQFGIQRAIHFAATPRGAFHWFWNRIKPGLVKVAADADPRKIAGWLGTAIVNGAEMAGAGSGKRKMWLSRRDDKVRPFHVDADGQTVGIRQQFVVCDGRKMDFPGQPVGDPDCWINCRCVSRIVDRAVTAAGDEPREATVIVAIPAADDPIWGVSSEQVPHCTLIFLGDQDLGEAMDRIREAVAVVAADTPPVDAPIRGREPLGDEDADVAMIEPGALRGARDAMLTDPSIRTAYDAVEQYPQWTPHSTLGYPDTPATGEPGQSIRFDRLAVWDADYAGEEYPMSGEAAVLDDPDVMPEDPGLDVAAGAIPWYGVLAPEGEWSGDGRMFADGALTWRDLPIPLLWQERGGMGHDGAVVVGSIADIWKEDNLVWGSGTFANVPAADTVIGLLADGHLRGVSVDVDSAEMSMDDDDEFGRLTFNQGRISAATVVPIPAFHQAFVALGTRERPTEPVDAEPLAASVAPKFKTRDAQDVQLPFASDAPGLLKDGSAPQCSFCDNQATGYVVWAEGMAFVPHCADHADVPKFAPDISESDIDRRGDYAAFKDYDTKQRKEKADSGQAMPDGSFPIADEEDLRNAIQAIGRAKDPDAAKAHIKKRARALGKEDLIPEQWAVSHRETASLYFAGLDPEMVALVRGSGGQTFKRGPGWVTDPIATRRIHDYWTVPGHEGYAKIGWGTPGDFTRLRAYLAKYLDPKFLNRTTAQWHHDALGYWPGEAGKPGNPPVGARRHAGETVDAAVALLAAGGWCAPSAWFIDPGLTGPTPLSVADDGRVFGHLATWGTCHIGIPGVCTEPPRSPSHYAYYLTGTVETDAGHIPVGQITMATGHASTAPGVTARAAAAHYDNTGTVVADVVAGEDEHGIWVAGALRPGSTDEQRAALRAGALSGDWRTIRGALELVAALVVNVPGFPIPRTALSAAAGEQVALVAAGICAREAPPQDLVAAVADEVEARAARRKRAAAVLNETRQARVAALLTTVEV